METEQRSTQRWRQLQRAAAGKRFVFSKTDSWDRVENEGDDLETSEARGWQWLKAVSMMAFSGRASDDKTVQEMEPLRQHAKSGSENAVAAAERGTGVNRPQGTSSQVQVLIPPEAPAALGSNNSVHDVAVDVASVHQRSPQTAQNKEEVTVHGTTVDQIKEEQGRCVKYSQKALGFAVCTFIGYANAAPTDKKTTFRVAIAPFFVAICADLFSLKTKAKQGSVLVYLSSFHLMLMIYLIFISFSMDYAYAILFLPLVAGASLLQQKLRPHQVQPQSTDDKASKELDSIFDLSALILNWSSFIAAIMSVFKRFAPGGNQHISAGAAGFLFLLTIILGLYLMLVTTVRTVALNLRPKYLDVLLICLLVSTLIAALIMFTKTELNATGSSDGNRQ